MSLFPRHLAAGQTLTIHLRQSPSQPCLPLIQVSIRDPRGETVFERSQQTLSWVPEPAADASTPKILVEGVYELTPLLFVAEYLGHDRSDRSELARVLEDIGHARHAYLQWTVPEDAPLGRYEVLVSAWVNGHEHLSPTAKDDHFFVEHLTLESWQRAPSGALARVRNHSQEPTPARVYEWLRTESSSHAPSAPGIPALAMSARREILPPSSVTELWLKSERALLGYAEDARSLWLTQEPEPTYVRNQRCAWMTGRDDTVLITSKPTGRTFSLRDPARSIWLTADGFTSRSELRDLGSEAFDAMVDAQLLIELSERTASAIDPRL